MTGARWRGLFAGIVAVALLVYAQGAFLIGPWPSQWAYDRWIIADDARQFLAWTARLGDPGALPGNLMADYWHSVSPPAYRLIFALPAAIGVPPTLTARLLGLLLLPLTGWAAWRAARHFAPTPFATFIAAAAVMARTVHEGWVFSATPRAGAVVLLLLFLDGRVARRPAAALTAVALLALVYPALALVCLGALGLSHVVPRLALAPRAVAGTAAAGIVAVAAVLPFTADTAAWKPTATLAQALRMPIMGLPQGRGAIVAPGGGIGWLCSERMGLLPPLAGCGAVVPDALNLLLFALLLGWIWRHRRERVGEVTAQAVLAGVILWAAAALLAFRLHLPSRYGQRVIALAELLALGGAAGAWLERWRAGRVIATLAAGAAMVTIVPKLVRPRDRAAVTLIAGLPPATRIAGMAPDLDLVPALAGRAVLASPEQAVPYQLGYFRPLHDRLRDTAVALTARDPRVLAGFVRRWRVDVIAADADFLRTGALPSAWQGVLPEFTPPPGAPPLARAPCALNREGRMRLYDARCLARLGR